MERSYRNDIDWRDLCEEASKEQDSEKLIEIVQRLNEVWNNADGRFAPLFTKFLAPVRAVVRR